jgi:hypothetical protein
MAEFGYRAAGINRNSNAISTGVLVQTETEEFVDASKCHEYVDLKTSGRKWGV